MDAVISTGDVFLTIRTSYMQRISEYDTPPTMKTEMVGESFLAGVPFACTVQRDHPNGVQYVAALMHKSELLPTSFPSALAIQL